MKRSSLYFVGERQLELREEPLLAPGSGQVLVETRLSAISPGTEMLIYRNQFPDAIQADDTIEALNGNLAYPLKYGYSVVGEVIEVGKDVPPDWIGERVFVFHPHESAFVTNLDQLIPIPEDIPDEEAVFLPNMETAVNFIMDGNPRMGEKAAVFGQGIVGLLTTALLAVHPLAELVTFDRFASRRDTSIELGATQSLDPGAIPEDLFQEGVYAGADLIFELSGAPEALNAAIGLAGFDSRIVIGSWYGSKRAELDLGGVFHRKRIRMVSSQVSTLSPSLMGRWSKPRRIAAAWDQIRRVKPSKLITQRYSLEQAETAYHLIDEDPGKSIQVILTYK